MAKEQVYTHHDAMDSFQEGYSDPRQVSIDRFKKESLALPSIPHEN